jgi:hypothetical protein
MQFNYQIISCAFISTMYFILIILTFLKCNTFIQYTRLWIYNRTKVLSNKYNFFLRIYLISLVADLYAIFLSHYCYSLLLLITTIITLLLLYSKMIVYVK